MHINNLTLNKFKKNQKTSIKYVDELLVIKSKQNISTPGIIINNIIFEKNTNYVININIKKPDSLNIFFYAKNIKKNKTNQRHYLNNGFNIINFVVDNDNIYDIGFLISNPNINDKIIVNNLIIKQNIDTNLINNKKYVLIIGDINLNFVDGCTIWWSSLINHLNEEGKYVIYISNYKIENNNNTRNLEYIDKVIILNPDRKQTGIEIKQTIESIIDKYNIQEIIIRSNELLDVIDEKWELLKICKIYGLEEHLKNVNKLNNNFKELLCQTEKLKNLYKDVDENKIVITPPKPYKYKFDIEKKNNDVLKIIYSGTLRDLENILEIIREFKKIRSKRKNVTLTICYGKIHGDKIFCKKIENIIKKGVDGIDFKFNLSCKEVQMEIAKSDIGIFWRKKGYGDYEESTKLKEYNMYNLKVYNNFDI